MGFQWLISPVEIIFISKNRKYDHGNKDLELFRNLLIQWLEELLDHAKETVEGLLYSQENFADPLDRATFESDQDASHQRQRKYVDKNIRQSLGNIENGEYGICEDCSEDISIERLKAKPVKSLCIGCKTKRESLEKLTGT